MTEIRDTSEAIYDEVVDQKEGSSATAVAAELERRARKAQEGEMDEAMPEGWEEENDAADRSQTPAEGQREAAENLAATLNATANDLRTCMKGARLEEFDDNTLGEAQLASSGGYDADLRKLKAKGGDGASLLDANKARDLDAHETEHTRQSQTADADEITIGTKTLEAWEVRELGAMSVQDDLSFVSNDYQRIAATTTIDAAERQLIRDGKFLELERKKNGGRVRDVMNAS